MPIYLLIGLLEKNAEHRSSWNAVKSSAWVENVEWDDMLRKKVNPPWIPSAQKKPSVENFVKWNFSVPSQSIGPDVTAYCSSITFPNPRSARMMDGNSTQSKGGCASSPPSTTSPVTRRSKSMGGPAGNMEKRQHSKSNMGALEKRNSKVGELEKRQSKSNVERLEKRNSKAINGELEKRQSKSNMGSIEKRNSKLGVGSANGNSSEPVSSPDSVKERKR